MSGHLVISIFFLFMKGRIGTSNIYIDQTKEITLCLFGYSVTATAYMNVCVYLFCFIEIRFRVIFFGTGGTCQ